MNGHTHITRIETEGLRATDRSLDLAPLTILKGPVGSGKTTIADAIRMGFLGHVPSIGKDSTAITRLMRDGKLNVKALLSDGQSMERGYKRTAKGLSGKASASWMGPKSKLTEITESIRSLVGRDDKVAGEHLDLRQLLSCKPNERSRRIEELLDASGIPLEEQIRRTAAMTILRLADVKLERMPKGLDEAEKAAEGAKALLEAPVKKALDEAPELIEKELKTGGTTRAIDVINEKKKESSESLRRRIAARAELEDRVNALEVPAIALSEAEKRREEALERKAAAKRDLEEAERVKGIRERYEPAIPMLKQGVEEAEAAMKTAQERLPRAQEAIAEAEALQDPPEIDAPEVIQPDPEKINEAEALNAEATKLSHEADKEEIPEPVNVFKEEAAHNTALIELEKAKRSPWREVEKITDELEECNFECFAGPLKNAVPFLRLRELAREHGGPLDELKADAEAKKKRLEDATDLMNETQIDIEAAQAHQRELRQEAEKKRCQADSIRREAEAAAKAANEAGRDAYARKVGERAVELEEISQKRKALLQEAELIKSSAIDAQSILDAARSDLRAAQERLNGIASVTVDVEKAKAVYESAVTELTQLDAQLETLRGAESLQKEMQALIAEIDEDEAFTKIWKATEWALQQIRDMDMAARAGGLQDLMRRYLRAAGRTEEPYLRSDKGIFDFGWRRGGLEISVEALSGGETVLFCATLAGAIISLRNPTIRILPLEAAELGLGAESQQLLYACREMHTSGDIDQIIVATCLDIDPIEGWEVIELAAEPVGVGHG